MTFHFRNANKLAINWNFARKIQEDDSENLNIAFSKTMNIVWMKDEIRIIREEDDSVSMKWKSQENMETTPYS